VSVFSSDRPLSVNLILEFRIYKHPNFTIPPEIEQKLVSPVAPEAIRAAFNQNTDVYSVPELAY
jgi:hypothetical protein